MSKNTGNLQPRQIWLIGSWVFDSNTAHLEIVLYLHQPAAKDGLLLELQKQRESVALSAYIHFIWEPRDNCSVTGSMI